MTASVWYLIPALSVGGTERTLVELANGLNKDRHDVTVWTIFEQNPLADRLASDVRHRTLGVQGVIPNNEARIARAERPIEYPLAPLRFIRAVRTHKPDILQSFLFYDNVIARIAGKTTPETTVISGVRSVPDSQPISQALLDRVTLPLSDYVVSNSRAGVQYVADRGASRNRIGVVPNGRNLSKYRDADSSNVRRSLGLQADSRLVGTVGRLIERKGQMDLLEAWPAVRSHHGDAHLVLVGDGPERETLEARVAKMGESDTVHFLGMREDVPNLLASFDAFAFPSHFEGLPGALIEAMAAGLPIVTTPVNGNSELIENYRNGLHVSPKHPDQLAWALIRILAEPELAASLGKQAQADAFEQYTVDRMVTAFETIYNRL